MLKLLSWPVMASAMFLGACSKEVPVATSKPFCRAVKPVCISKDDVLTDGTATQIEANNLGHRSVCGRPPKCKI